MYHLPRACAYVWQSCAVLWPLTSHQGCRGGGGRGGSQRLKVTVCEVAACEHFGDVLRGMRDGSEQNGKGKRGLLFHTN